MTDKGTYATDTQVADYFGIHRATVWYWTKCNDFPPPVKLGPQVTRWRWAEVEAWAASKRGALGPQAVGELNA